jgi:UDP-N-acetylglucosamine--N-acetylmuramyl-(pentapeptide) pyrophosphoryl-undecaprenol N-acetylglucosamine transferase
VIVLVTGGGSAGHVLPNLPVIERLLARGHRVHYAGSGAELERRLLAGLDIDYHVLPTGKLRRYLSLDNVRDAGRVVRGVVGALSLVRRLRPDVLFSKGGFVSVPPVLAAALCRVPVITHESDLTPGLANRIALRVAVVACCTFAETELPAGRARKVHTGIPLRPALLAGDAARGRAFTGTAPGRPLLVVMGGSLGARRLNEFVRANLPRLLAGYDVVHLCGAGNVDAAAARPGYVQHAFLDAPLGDVLAAAAAVVSRAGATALYELLALGKPTLLVPLPRSASRGDQLENARWALRHGAAAVLEESALSPDAVLSALAGLRADGGLAARMRAVVPPGDAAARIVDLIEARGA